MSKEKKATIQDIAEFAGVSTGTVDRVIHNRGKVIVEKKQRIEDAIKQLNFNPNLLARTLALKKQFVISSLLPKPSDKNSYWTLPKKGIEQSFINYGDYGMLHDSHEFSLFNESSFIEKANLILDRNPDGVILAPIFEKESLQFINELSDRKIPYVFIDVNIQIKNCFSYIGPNLKSSGEVAGKIFSSILNDKDDILIVNMMKGRAANLNLNSVENGFREYFENHFKKKSGNIFTLNMNTINEEIVQKELHNFYEKQPFVKGVFVTNSRAHIISQFHKRNNLKRKVIGFDLVEENIIEMKNGNIDCIISQSPVFQGSKSVQTMFEYFINKKEPVPVQHVPLDIIIKENIDFYINSE